MKSKTIYICELCGKEFANEAAANSHEEAHIKIDKLSSANYGQNTAHPPHSIQVTFSDGIEIEYFKERD